MAKFHVLLSVHQDDGYRPYARSMDRRKKARAPTTAPHLPNVAVPLIRNPKLPNLNSRKPSGSVFFNMDVQ